MKFITFNFDDFEEEIWCNMCIDGIDKSSFYKNIEVEKYLTSDNGRRFKIYRSRINKAEIIIKKPEPVVLLSANREK